MQNMNSTHCNRFATALTRRDYLRRSAFGFGALEAEGRLLISTGFRGRTSSIHAVGFPSTSQVICEAFGSTMARSTLSWA